MFFPIPNMRHLVLVAVACSKAHGSQDQCTDGQCEVPEPPELPKKSHRKVYRDDIDEAGSLVEISRTTGDGSRKKAKKKQGYVGVDDGIGGTFQPRDSRVSTASTDIDSFDGSSSIGSSTDAMLEPPDTPLPANLDANVRNHPEFVREAIVHVCSYVHSGVKFFFIGSNAGDRDSPFSSKYRQQGTSDYDITVLPSHTNTKELVQNGWNELWQQGVIKPQTDGSDIFFNVPQEPGFEENPLSYQIKFMFAHGPLAGVQVDNTIVLDVNLFQNKRNMHKTLEKRFVDFRNSAISSLVQRAGLGDQATRQPLEKVFDLFIRVIKAIKPDGCSSVKAVMFAFVSFSTSSKQEYTQEKIRQEFGESLKTMTKSQVVFVRLMNNFRHFVETFLGETPTEGYPHYTTHWFLLDHYGKVLIRPLNMAKSERLTEATAKLAPDGPNVWSHIKPGYYTFDQWAARLVVAFDEASDNDILKQDKMVKSYIDHLYYADGQVEAVSLREEFAAQILEVSGARKLQERVQAQSPSAQTHTEQERTKTQSDIDLLQSRLKNSNAKLETATKLGTLEFVATQLVGKLKKDLHDPFFELTSKEIDPAFNKKVVELGREIDTLTDKVQEIIRDAEIKKVVSQLDAIELQLDRLDSQLRENPGLASTIEDLVNKNVLEKIPSKFDHSLTGRVQSLITKAQEIIRGAEVQKISSQLDVVELQLDRIDSQLMQHPGLAATIDGLVNKNVLEQIPFEFDASLTDKVNALIERAERTIDRAGEAQESEKAAKLLAEVSEATTQARNNINDLLQMISDSGKRRQLDKQIDQAIAALADLSQYTSASKELQDELLTVIRRAQLKRAHIQLHSTIIKSKTGALENPKMSLQEKLDNAERVLQNAADELVDTREANELRESIHKAQEHLGLIAVNAAIHETKTQGMSSDVDESATALPAASSSSSTNPPPVAEPEQQESSSVSQGPSQATDAEQVSSALDSNMPPVSLQDVQQQFEEVQRIWEINSKTAKFAVQKFDTLPASMKPIPKKKRASQLKKDPNFVDPHWVSLSVEEFKKLPEDDPRRTKLNWQALMAQKDNVEKERKSIEKTMKKIKNGINGIPKNNPQPAINTLHKQINECSTANNNFRKQFMGFRVVLATVDYKLRFLNDETKQHFVDSALNAILNIINMYPVYHPKWEELESGMSIMLATGAGDGKTSGPAILQDKLNILQDEKREGPPVVKVTGVFRMASWFLNQDQYRQAASHHALTLQQQPDWDMLVKEFALYGAVFDNNKEMDELRNVDVLFHALEVDRFNALDLALKDDADDVLRKKLLAFVQLIFVYILDDTKVNAVHMFVDVLRKFHLPEGVRKEVDVTLHNLGVVNLWRSSEVNIVTDASHFLQQRSGVFSHEVMEDVCTHVDSLVRSYGNLAVLSYHMFFLHHTAELAKAVENENSNEFQEFFFSTNSRTFNITRQPTNTQTRHIRNLIPHVHFSSHVSFLVVVCVKGLGKNILKMCYVSFANALPMQFKNLVFPFREKHIKAVDEFSHALIEYITKKLEQANNEAIRKSGEKIVRLITSSINAIEYLTKLDMEAYPVVVQKLIRDDYLAGGDATVGETIRRHIHNIFAGATAANVKQQAGAIVNFAKHADLPAQGKQNK